MSCVTAQYVNSSKLPEPALELDGRTLVWAPVPGAQCSPGRHPCVLVQDLLQHPHYRHCNHTHALLPKQASPVVFPQSSWLLLLLLLIVTRFVSQPPLLSRCTCQHDTEPSGKLRHASMTESRVVKYGHQTCYPANAILQMRQLFFSAYQSKYCHKPKQCE